VAANPKLNLHKVAAGAQDPWVRSFWARRLKRRVPSVTYYSLSPAGHCPHHEVPAAVNTILLEWVAAQVRMPPLHILRAHFQQSLVCPDCTLDIRPRKIAGRYPGMYVCMATHTNIMQPFALGSY
jgi:hypothetical protein